MKTIADIQKYWYGFIEWMPEPTKVYNKYQWGKIWQKLSPYPVAPMYAEFYCNIRLWEVADNTIILMSQDDDNPSKSITNACEEIATTFYKANNLQLDRIRWFESYTCYIYPTNGKEDIMFSEIAFSTKADGCLYSPMWQPYTKEKFKAVLTNQPVY